MKDIGHAHPGKKERIYLEKGLEGLEQGSKQKFKLLKQIVKIVVDAIFFRILRTWSSLHQKKFVFNFSWSKKYILIYVYERCQKKAHIAG